MAVYAVKCTDCGHEEEWLCGFAEKENREKTMECSACKKVGTYRQQFLSAPVVFYNGANWSSTTWSRTSGKGSKSQNDLDAALRENDALHKQSKEPKYQKVSDAIKRAEDKNLV